MGAARARYPQAPSPWLDLSTGVSPWAYPIPELSVECWSRLPDPADLARLIAAARRRYSAPEGAAVAAVAGTDLAIAILPLLFSTARDIAIVAPTYGAHEAAWRAGGHRVRMVDDLDDLIGDGIGVVVNPNNPDGQIWPRDQIAGAADRLKKSGGLLIIDEAFADVAPGSSFLSPDADLSNVIVLRSFGKFYGLAGVRLGFVITGHSVAAALADSLSAWPVSGPAIEIGCAALSNEDWADENVHRLEAAASRLDDILQAAGFTVIGGTALFRLASRMSGWRVFDLLAQQGILTRPIRSTGEAIRFGVPGRDEDFERLRSALATL